MSNQKTPLATIPGHQGPFYPTALERLQRDTYSVSHHKRHPVTSKFLTYFAEELMVFFAKVKFRDNFVTSDGTVWMAVSFVYADHARYRVLFPKGRDRHHTDGTISAHHIALYCVDVDEEISPENLEQIGKSICQLFQLEQRHFAHA